MPDGSVVMLFSRNNVFCFHDGPYFCPLGFHCAERFAFLERVLSASVSYRKKVIAMRLTRLAAMLHQVNAAPRPLRRSPARDHESITATHATAPHDAGGIRGAVLRIVAGEVSAWISCRRVDRRWPDAIHRRSADRVDSQRVQP